MKLRQSAILLAAAGSALSLSVPAQAGSDPFIGQIMTTGHNFCPRGFAPADGQLISIAQNTALFSLLGTFYGGNGTSTFALPNLNGRAPIGSGSGPGLPTYSLGQTDGTTTIQLTAGNLPAHTHSGTLRAVPTAGDSSRPVRNSLAMAPSGKNVYSTATPANNMNAGDINIMATGGGEAFSNESPYLVVQHCIATQGVFPSRP